MPLSWDFPVLFGILVLGIALCQVGGAFIYATVSATTLLPWVGPVFAFVLGKPVHLIGVVKLFTWVVSSSGLIVGYWAYSAIWKEPASRPEYWAMLIVASISVMRIGSHLVMFNLLPFKDAFHGVSKFVPRSALNVLNDADERHKLAVQNFIAFYLTQFFRLLIAIGFVFYSVGRLELVNVVEQPTLFESVGMAFAQINLAAQGGQSYSGPTWVVLRTLAAFLVFYWTVLFISLAASAINKDDFDPTKVE